MRLRLFRAPRMAEAHGAGPRRAGRGRGDPGRPAGSRGGVEVTAALDAPGRAAESPGWMRRTAAHAAEARPESARRSWPAAPPALARHNLPPALAAQLAAGPLDRALAAALGFAPLPDAAGSRRCCWSARPAPARR